MNQIRYINVGESDLDSSANDDPPPLNSLVNNNISPEVAYTDSHTVNDEYLDLKSGDLSANEGAKPVSSSIRTENQSALEGQVSYESASSPGIRAPESDQVLVPSRASSSSSRSITRKTFCGCMASSSGKNNVKEKLSKEIIDGDIHDCDKKVSGSFPSPDRAQSVAEGSRSRPDAEPYEVTSKLPDSRIHSEAEDGVEDKAYSEMDRNCTPRASSFSGESRLASDTASPSAWSPNDRGQKSMYCHGANRAAPPRDEAMVSAIFERLYLHQTRHLANSTFGVREEQYSFSPQITSKAHRIGKRQRSLDVVKRLYPRPSPQAWELEAQASSSQCKQENEVKISRKTSAAFFQPPRSPSPSSRVKPHKSSARSLHTVDMASGRPKLLHFGFFRRPRSSRFYGRDRELASCLNFTRDTNRRDKINRIGYRWQHHHSERASNGILKTA